MRICFVDNHSLGDTCENLIAIRDFKMSNPRVSVGFRGFAQELFDNVPWIDKSITRDNADMVYQITQDLIHQSSQNGLHVVRAIEYDMQQKLGYDIKPGSLVLPIHFTREELEDHRIFDENGIPENYWIIDAGGKTDNPTKHYPMSYFQQIVNMTKGKVNWVQIGKLGDGHFHKPLDGVVNLLGKTDNLRDLLKIFYFSSGVLSIISAPLHLSAMPMAHSNFPRPCVVLGGGRENPSWTLYPNHHWFSSVGMLDCCRRGCWKSKVVNDCKHPEKVDEQDVPLCQKMISPVSVAEMVMKLYERS